MQAPLPEAQVVRGDLEEECQDHDSGDRCERMLLADPRPHQRCAEPRDPDDEGEDPHPEPDRRQMLHERMRHPAREQIPLGRNGIGPEQTREPAGGEQDQRGEHEAAVRHGQDAMSGHDSAAGSHDSPSQRPAGSKGELVDHERERQRDEQDGELRPREDRQAEGEE